MKIRARLFIKQTLSEGLSIIPENKVMHYLSSVMRLKSGENILLFNGIDGEWLAEFQILSRRDAILHILHQKRIQPLHIPILKLYFAPLKKTPLDFLIQKATELGVTHFQPVITEYTNSEKLKVERLSSQIIEASEQCRRLDIAKISHPISFSDLISSLSSQTVLFYGDERGKGKPIHMTFAEGGSQDIQFLIGPEGGFSPEEFAILENYSYIKPFTLGPYTLRAETAAIAAIVASRLYFEHWGHPLNSTA